MDKIISFCDTLDLSKLEQQIGSFKLVIDKVTTETQYKIFSYQNGTLAWQALYDKEVEDFTVFIHTALLQFNDISFIKPDGKEFWENLFNRYISAITNTLEYPEKSFSYGYKKKGIANWEYSQFLPTNIGPYQLTISPNKGVRGINGTYYIAEYAKTTEKTGLALCYNVYREDFFAELYHKGIAIITHDLDASNLTELEVVLEKNLHSLLESVNYV